MLNVAKNNGYDPTWMHQVSKVLKHLLVSLKLYHCSLSFEIVHSIWSTLRKILRSKDAIKTYKNSKWVAIALFFKANTSKATSKAVSIQAKSKCSAGWRMRDPYTRCINTRSTWGRNPRRQEHVSLSIKYLVMSNTTHDQAPHLRKVKKTWGSVSLCILCWCTCIFLVGP